VTWEFAGDPPKWIHFSVSDVTDGHVTLTGVVEATHPGLTLSGPPSRSVSCGATSYTMTELRDQVLAGQNPRVRGYPTT
jgi:hypothetical protein